MITKYMLVTHLVERKTNCRVYKKQCKFCFETVCTILLYDLVMFNAIFVCLRYLLVAGNIQGVSREELP